MLICRECEEELRKEYLERLKKENTNKTIYKRKKYTKERNFGKF